MGPCRRSDRFTPESRLSSGSGLGFTLDEVRRLKAVLDDLVAECASGTMPDCPIIETLYREPR